MHMPRKKVDERNESEREQQTAGSFDVDGMTVFFLNFNYNVSFIVFFKHQCLLFAAQLPSKKLWLFCFDLS
jgi:hypothetical protein